MIIDADVRIFYSYAECLYAGCHYSDRSGAARKKCGLMLKSLFFQHNDYQHKNGQHNTAK
jgi:hypothetical protein